MNRIAITMFPDFSVFPLPRVVRIEPASLCNLRCIHCPRETNTNMEWGIMSDKVFSKIIEDIKSYNEVDVVVLYHGGEPFLNKKIFQMIHALKTLGIRHIKIVTNGTVIKNDMLVKIIESGLDSIEFSIDGRSPEENDNIRKGGKFYKVAPVIKDLLLLKNKIGSAHPDVYIANTQIPDRAIIKNGIEISTPRYLEEYFSDFKKEIKFKSTYMIKWPGFECSGNYELVEGKEDKKSPPSNYCNHIVETITLRSDGNVVPCCYDITNEYVCGNMLSHSLKDIWNNQRYKELRKSIYERNYKPLCINCSVIRPQLFVARI